MTCCDPVHNTTESMDVAKDASQVQVVHEDPYGHQNFAAKQEKTLIISNRKMRTRIIRQCSKH